MGTENITSTYNLLGYDQDELVLKTS